MKVLCDTHVHCYQFEQLSKLLDCALSNFAKQGLADARVLFFTDGERDKTWPQLLPLAEAGHELHGWTLQLAGDTGFISAKNASNELLLAPARQVNSANRIEFLLLGCDENIAQGLHEEDLATQYGSRFAVICPWGVGKWLGARGKLMNELIQKHADKLILGDNGGRPTLWSRVPQFTQSERRVLNGSDPLPIDGELERIAAFGVSLEIQTDRLTLSGLLEALKSGDHKNYGKGMSLRRFIASQIAMRRA